MPLKKLLACGVSLAGLMISGAAWAQPRDFNLPRQTATHAIPEFSRQAGVQIVASGKALRGITTPPLKGKYDVREALNLLLKGTDVKIATFDDNLIVLAASAPRAATFQLASLVDIAPAPPTGAQASEAQPQARLEEVIVTAQRRGENLQDVPISVSAVSAEQLEAAGITGTADLKLSVAGVDVPVASGFASPFIRGVGSKIIGPATEGAVATYVDNVYIGNVVASLLSFNNIARVEVLKGPQGTLFGRNTTGGLISVITRDPTDDLQLDARVSYGNYQTVNADLYVGGPLQEGIKADFAAYAKHQGEGYGANLFTGEDVGRTHYDFGVRTKWVLGNGPLTVKLSADYATQKTSVFVQRIAFGFTAPPGYATGVNYGGSPWDTDLTISPLIKTQNGGLSARVDYEINPAVTFTSITAWRKTKYHNRFDADITRTSARVIDGRQIDEQLSQEFQLLSGPASPFTWVVGAFLYEAKGKNAPNVFLVDGPARAAPGPFQGVAVNRSYSQQKVHSLAPFAQATVEVFDATKLTLGLRYTQEKRTQFAESRSFSPTGAQAGPTLVTPVAFRQLDADKLTWRIALDHQFGPDVLGYVSYNRGFKSGGANPTNVTAPMYGPEELDAYEVGLKSTLFDRKVRLNGAAFYYDYTDVQVASVEAGVASIFNAATARAYGLDLEMDAQITSRLRVNAGLSYLDAEFEDFPNAPTNRVNPTGGVRQTFQSAAGNKLPNAPESVITAGVTYTVPIGDNTLQFTGNVYHSSSYFTEPDNFRSQGAYELYNASVEYTLHDQWSFALWGKNLSDEPVDLFPNVNGLGGGIGIARSAFAPPRTYGVTVGLEF